MKNKKFMSSLCATAAVLGTAAVALGTIVSCGANPHVDPETKGDYTIEFNPGNGRFVDSTLSTQKVYKGQTFDRIDKPEVASNISKLQFSGWVDSETKKPVYSNQKITKNLKLTATYDATVGDYCTVSFVGTDIGTRIIGNASVSVKKGHLFFMINRPTAKATNKYFNGWLYGEDVHDPDKPSEIIHYAGEPVTENDKIVTSMKLVPDFTRAVTVKWDANTADGGYIGRGSSSTTLAEGTTFDLFNQPELGNTKGSYFQYWVDKASGQKVAADYPVWDSMEVIAVWGAPKPVEGYTMINFVQPADDKSPGTSGLWPRPTQDGPQPTDIQYAPSSTVVTETGASATPVEWSKLVKPNVTSESLNWEMLTATVTHPTTSEEVTENCWEISTDDRKTWKILNDWDMFGKDPGGAHTGINYYDAESCYVRPVMKSSITGISIYGDSDVLPELTTQYVPTVEGGNTQTCTYDLYAEDPATVAEPAKLDSKIATVDEYGYVTVGSLSEVTTFWLKATSTVNKSKFGSKQINVVMPYNWTKNGFNQKIWYQNVDGETKEWRYLDPAELCINDKSIGSYNSTRLADGSTTQIIKSGAGYFNNTIYLGSAFKSIPDQFMIDWSDFNGNIILPSSVTKIGDAVMENCVNFNKKLNLENITEIGSHFLYNAKKFNNGYTGAEGETPQPLTMPKVTSLGDNFLALCTSFNVPITLPSTLTTIGNYFLYGCTSFNQNITFPSSLTKFGAFCMTDCVNFTSTLTLNCSSSAFSQNIHDFSANKLGETTTDDEGNPVTVQYPIVSKGFTVASDSQTLKVFLEKYPTSKSNFVFRTLTNGSGTRTKPTQAVWDAAWAKIYSDTPNYSVTSQIYTEKEVWESQTIQVDGTSTEGLLKTLNTLYSSTYYTEQNLTELDSIAKVYNYNNGRFNAYKAPNDTYLYQTMENLVSVQGYVNDWTAAESGWSDTNKRFEYDFTDGDKNFKAEVQFDSTNTNIESIQLYNNLGGKIKEMGAPWYFENYGKVSIPTLKKDDTFADHTMALKVQTDAESNVYKCLFPLLKDGSEGVRSIETGQFYGFKYDFETEVAPWAESITELDTDITDWLDDDTSYHDYCGKTNAQGTIIVYNPDGVGNARWRTISFNTNARVLSDVNMTNNCKIWVTFYPIAYDWGEPAPSGIDTFRITVKELE